jgi:Na+/melibiose symporter-like transporter
VTSTRTTDAVGTYRSALRSRPFVWTVLQYTCASVAIGIVAVVVSIELFRRSGSTTWASVGVLARIVPFLVCSPIAGVLGDRYDGVKTIRLATGSVTVGAAALWLAVGQAPLWSIAVVGVVSHVLWTPGYPAAASLVPRMVDSGSLAAGVGIVTASESVSWLVGPGLGGLLISTSGPRAAAGVAVLFGVVASISGLMLRRTWARPADSNRSEVARGRFGAMLTDGFHTILSTRSVFAPLAILLAGEVAYGASQVVLLVAATDLFGLSAGGFGLLGAAISGGALAALLVVNPLARSRRPSTVLVAVLLLEGVPVALSAASGSSSIAIPLFVCSGVGMVASEVLLLTTLQRNAPRDQLSRLFGILDSLLIASMIVGSLAAAPLMAVLGVRGSLMLIGVLFPAISVALIPAIVADQGRARRVGDLADRIVLLGGLRVLRHASRVAIEALAAGANEVDVVAGTSVVVQGEHADAFYAVIEGDLDVHVTAGDGTTTLATTVRAGDGFGELGLLHAVPRQATVTARTDAKLLRVPGVEFVRVLGPGRVTGGGVGVAGSLRDLWAAG